MWNWLLRIIKKDKYRAPKIIAIEILLAHLEVSQKSDCKSLIYEVEVLLKEFESAVTIDVSDALKLYNEPSELIDIAKSNDWLQECLSVKAQLEFYQAWKLY
ncbi:hypothetical protein [Pseudoalteromonas umbrosa]|uniref:hypothetical protein n=1 Tax=Pseudoalteromonas umbrosa TaxID=3048489 RepID=UPI0024C240D2|nr:hypothetical protein [Pseudoalteromonas sp. B95]MDK1286252.1 hypothetical protein [Pseudoalteromonas sp. B95]